MGDIVSESANVGMFELESTVYAYLPSGNNRENIRMLPKKNYSFVWMVLANYIYIFTI